MNKLEELRRMKKRLLWAEDRKEWMRSIKKGN